MSDDDYTGTPTHLRITASTWSGAIAPARREWILDGADDQGRCTELVWTFDTWAEAVASMLDFVRIGEDYGCHAFTWRKR